MVKLTVLVGLWNTQALGSLVGVVAVSPTLLLAAALTSAFQIAGPPQSAAASCDAAIPWVCVARFLAPRLV
jgi:hypothetical protein